MAAFVYINGEIVTGDDARLSANDSGLLYGFGFFETFRTSGGYPHHWSYNRRRLLQASETAGLAVPPTALAHDEAKLQRTVAEMLQRAGLPDAVFRYTVTAGASAGPSEILSLRPLPPAALPDGIVLRTLNLTRDNGEWLPRPKSLNYLNALMGARELQRRQAHAGDEGLFLAREGNWVVETVRQNVAWVVDDGIYYADPVLGGIPGTCLSWLLEQGMSCRAATVPLQALARAEAVFVLNSVRGITPVREVYDQSDVALGRTADSARHRVVLALQQRWTDALAITASRAPAQRS